ncbi:preprotein translocase subunit SecE [Agrococcus sp. SL85]|uniref:preprotein translocase subunit SecE n=1 Tax=Agrococcus sp. SL85 TaxID=2995141 RepID=UPI00226C917B|nr:preprotein translocase subunit SecE [Agrococcus sp. SL85]WAC67465.1 preprotein translocase subunit SecE [Agrococcus sp. SL85]
MTFFREVLVELRKVVTPTRRELIRYTLVVLVFVVIMMLLVSGLDLLFGSFVGWVFGDLPMFGLGG